MAIQIDVYARDSDLSSHISNTNNPHSTTAIQANALSSSSFDGLQKISVGTGQPGSPVSGDLWVDTN
jgi:hypothetical protein